MREDAATRGERRDQALSTYEVVGAPARRELAALVELAAQMAGVPFASINLLSSHSQHHVATIGFDGSDSPLEIAMCRQVEESGQPIAVADAGTDPRFADNPWTTGELAAVKYYGSHPLVTPAGVLIGTLCVYDSDAHPVTPEASRGLAQLADRVVDVLELELASRRLVDANARLERSNERLAAFAGQVSHDLKNPLTSLSLSLELLEDEVEDLDARETIARARRASARMDGLIDHLLEYAATGDTPRQELVDLSAEVAHVIEDMGASLESASVRVGPLPHVSGDPSQLRSVLQNLVQNAVKFTRSGVPPEIDVSAVEVSGAHRIEVADRGTGVTAEHREHVFAPLARLNRKVPGFGIGLATSRRIVEAHGGRIGVDPREGGGSVFWLELPAQASG